MGISATLGRDDNWREHNTPLPGANSHVSKNKFEYIVFNREQIITCYVIHLDWGQDNARFFGDIPTDSSTWVNPLQTRPEKLNQQVLTPGDRQRIKQALQSRATKWFPYGYGPAAGTSFVVEAVSEVDEDDEDYGTYQTDRIEEADEGRKGEGDVWSWANDNPEDDDGPMNEYLESRRPKSQGLTEHPGENWRTS